MRARLHFTMLGSALAFLIVTVLTSPVMAQVALAKTPFGGAYLLNDNPSGQNLQTPFADLLSGTADLGFGLDVDDSGPEPWKVNGYTFLVLFDDGNPFSSSGVLGLGGHWNGKSIVAVAPDFANGGIDGWDVDDYPALLGTTFVHESMHVFHAKLLKALANDPIWGPVIACHSAFANQYNDQADACFEAWAATKTSEYLCCLCQQVSDTDPEAAEKREQLDEQAESEGRDAKDFGQTCGLVTALCGAYPFPESPPDNPETPCADPPSESDEPSTTPDLSFSPPEPGPGEVCDCD